MRTLTALCLAATMAFAACKKAEQPAPPEEKMKAPEPTTTSTLNKWPADYPITGDSVAVISIAIDGTSIGDMVVEFYPDKAPNHVRNFKWLASHSFYNGVRFHRIMKGFMAQTGDPTGTGMGGPGWKVNQEFNDTPHRKGVLSMARSMEVNSAGSQFFICDDLRKPQQDALDGKYTVFGIVIKGIDVLDKILSAPVTPSAQGENSVPARNVVMTSVRIVPRSAAGIE